MTFWKSRTFKALQREWYEKLEREGFKDNEDLVGDEMVLKPDAKRYFNRQSDLEREVRELYYYQLAQKIHEAEFRNEVDQIILVLWADGKKIKFICEELERRGKRRCRQTVAFTIRKYEMKWGMRVYTPRQLNRYKIH